MKKTTKFLLVLAAVVAMTIGAMSTVMAADVVVDSATWAEADNGTWSAKDTAGNQIASGWAVNESGHWFYFENKVALQNEFLRWRGNWYYFGEDCIMAEGWVPFTPDNDDPIVSDLGIDKIDGVDVLNDEKTAYGKKVWCFFEKGGVAAKDKWVEVEGLWYYFEDMIAVTGTYNYEIDGKVYGFSGDSNMHVGWIPVDNKTDSGVGPTASSKTANATHVYYKSNGQMVDAGWESIGGKWYYFVPVTAGSKIEDLGVEEGTNVMIHTAYLVDGAEEAIENLDAGDTTSAFFFGADGAMVTGNVKVGKKQKYYVSVAKFMDLALTESNNNEATYLFDATTGVQKTGTNGSNYYLTTTATGSSIYVLNGTYDRQDTVINFDKEYAVSKTNGTSVVGEKIYNAFYYKSATEIYYYDANGNMVKGDVVDFYGVTVAFGSDGKMVIKADADEYSQKFSGTRFYFDSEFGTVVIGNTTVNGCAAKKPSAE